MSSRCPICSGYYEFVFIKNHFPIHKCDKCGFMAVLTEIHPDEISELYEATYYEKDPERYITPTVQDTPWRRRLQLIESYRQLHDTSLRLLDIGCGTGVFISFAQSAGWDVYGVEISSMGRTEAQKSLGEGKVFQDIFELDPNCMFDVISMWAVIEHVRDPSEYLRKVKSLLKPGGVLAISTPNTASLNRMLWGKSWRYFIPPEHLVYFNANNLTLLLNTHQFDVLHTHTWFSKRAFEEGMEVALKMRNRMPYKFAQVLSIPLKVVTQLWHAGDTLELLARTK